ncbi:MAG: hypothetical protein H7123_08875 [Thermoleophilia bacterium]|nr:hypothetical protein [Thermoleophilia bacterium]
MGISIPPLTFLTTATRHAANIDLTAGLNGRRYNERNAYRTEYSGTQRYAAGVGTALGAIAPAAAASMWLNKGASVGGLSGKSLLAGRVAAGTALAGLTVVGGLEMRKIVQDDGHLGSLGSLGGLVGGYAAASALGKNASYRGVPLGTLIGGAGAIAGAIGGYQAGKLIHVGPGHLKEASANTTKTHSGVAGGALDFTRGAATSFINNGPITQGVNIDTVWHSDAVFKNETAKPEQAGGLVGNLGAAALLGGGALAVSKSLIGGKLSQGEQVLAKMNMAGRGINNADKVTGMVDMIKPGSSKYGMYAVAAGLGGVVSYNLFQEYSDGGKNVGKGLAIAGGTAAAGAGLGLLASKVVPGLRANAAASALTGALLVSTLSAVRMPIQAFFNQSKVIGETRPAASKPVQYGAAGVGAAAGGFGGFKLASRFAADLAPKWKAVAIGAGTLAGAAGLGYAAHAFTPFTVKSDAPAPNTPDVAVQ